MPHSDTFTDYSMGLIRLNKGTNEIKIQSGDNVGYGYALYDTVTVTKAVMPELNINLFFLILTLQKKLKDL